MQTLVTIIHIVVCLFLMLTVLLQSGKGGGMGAAFGGGGSTNTVFGGSGAGNFLRKLTAIAAGLFMLTSMTLAYMASSTGADALKRYSAQQRKGKLLEEEARAKAREGALQDGQPDAPAEGGETPATPEGTEGAAPEGASPATEGAAPEGASPATEGAAPEGAIPGAEGVAPEGATPGAQPAQPAAPAEGQPAPAQPGAAPAQPGAAAPTQGAPAGTPATP